MFEFCHNANEVEELGPPHFMKANFTLLVHHKSFIELSDKSNVIENIQVLPIIRNVRGAKSTETEIKINTVWLTSL